MPKNVVIIKAAKFDKRNEQRTGSFVIKVYYKCGYVDVRSH